MFKKITCDLSLESSCLYVNVIVTTTIIIITIIIIIIF